MTPDEMQEIKQRANAAELPNNHTVNRLKANLRECLGEIAALEERCQGLEEKIGGEKYLTDSAIEEARRQCIAKQNAEKRIIELEAALKMQGEGFLDQITALVNPLEAELVEHRETGKRWVESLQRTTYKHGRDEIRAKDTELERLRTALRNIASGLPSPVRANFIEWAKKEAEEALKPLPTPEKE